VDSARAQQPALRHVLDESLSGQGGPEHRFREFGRFCAADTAGDHDGQQSEEITAGGATKAHCKVQVGRKEETVNRQVAKDAKRE
jgi:hypothetical protein